MSHPRLRQNALTEPLCFWLTPTHIWIRLGNKRRGGVLNARKASLTTATNQRDTRKYVLKNKPVEASTDSDYKMRGVLMAVGVSLD